MWTGVFQKALPTAGTIDATASKASPQRAECDRAASHMATITAPARNACTGKRCGTSRSSPGKWATAPQGIPIGVTSP